MHRRFFRIAALVLLGGCSLRGAPATVEPGVAERAVRLTAPARPLRVIFRWRVLDGEARFSGEGAARIEPPYHARLDLFGAHGEGYLSAALVDADLRIPGEPDAVIPPPAMIWAVLGVVRPPDGAILESTEQSGNTMELRYATEGGRLRYGLEEDRLRSVEWRTRGRRMVVELEGGDRGVPEVATYRDWSRNTELHIELESVEDVEPYPPEIWTPGR